MKQNLTFWEILPVGLMLFSSFFGAGNLIFPPALGQAAGDHFWSAAIGFCVTGVGMPLLGIIAMALTKSDNPNALADPVHPNFAKVIVMLGVLVPFLRSHVPEQFLTTLVSDLLSLKITTPSVWLFIRSSFLLLPMFYPSTHQSLLTGWAKF